MPSSFSLSLTSNGKKVLDRLSKGGVIVDEAAKAVLTKSGLMILSIAKQEAPRQKSTLANSLTASPPEKVGNNYSTSVGSNVEYAPYQELGTGLYGPKHERIRPRNAKALKMTIGGSVIFRKTSKGIRPKKFLEKGFNYLMTHVEMAMEAADQVMQKL